MIKFIEQVQKVEWYVWVIGVFCVDLLLAPIIVSLLPNGNELLYTVGVELQTSAKVGVLSWIIPVIVYGLLFTGIILLFIGNKIKKNKLNDK